MTRQIPPGWYPDPSGAGVWRWWSGQDWTSHWTSHTSAAPRFNANPPRPLRSTERWKPEHTVILIFAIPVVLIALMCIIDGQWKAFGGLVILASLVGVPVGLVALAVRRRRLFRQHRAQVREYEAGLAGRADQEHHAMMRGDIAAGVFGAFQPPRLDRDMPDAEQMRRQAWQPDLDDAPPAVRPSNPAPWHIVTQFPTRQFRGGSSGSAE